VNLAKIMQKRLIVTGSTLRPRSIEEKAMIAQELKARAWPLLESGAVKVIIDRTFPFAKVQASTRVLRARRAHFGKVILEF
jgi:NADPH2:quinone reductase